MRFEVPQFIEIEDKIIGPLTWKQFVYLAGGVGLCIIFLLNLNFIVAVILSLPVIGLVGALAFHRVNNRPFSIFLESAVAYFTHSRLYLWRREEAQTVITKTEAPIAEPEIVVHDGAHPPQNTLTTLSRKLELHLPE